MLSFGRRSYLRATAIFSLCLLFLLSCNFTNKDPSEVLKSARKHVDNKEYAEALKDYKWFFENSTKIRSSMFGVKHSYCVDEWRKLGNLYKPALELYRAEILKRKNRLIEGETNWDLFMEFDALCEYDDKKNEVVEVFMAFDNDDQKMDFTKRIFSPIKEDLLSFGHIDICSKYTTDPAREAGHIIELHRLNVEFEKERANTPENCSFADTFYNDEAGYLLTVLKKSNRNDEFNKVKNILQSYYFPDNLKQLILSLKKNEGA
jgi:hypothetical protein